MAILIDSSIFIAIERQGLPPDETVKTVLAEDAAMASITASELLAGVYRADTAERRLRRETFVEAILGIMTVIPFDLLAARTHARIWSHLAATGQLIGAHDLLIAATALAYGYAVLTHNLRDFERVPGLVVKRPNWKV
ncbi:MAG: type II toxin-antitoxin system VapC family toxin [Dehalococcoidia bacterium]|nr:type II toxin-antitoxin system VapC family toxin [Dehalococcoidia bacterium]